MASSEFDGLRPNEAARLVGGAVRAAWRETRGKSTHRQDAAAARIREGAAKREREAAEVRKAAQAAKDKARLDAKKKAAIERATRRYR